METFVSVTECWGFANVATKVPEVGDGGGVEPVERRMTTPAKFVLAGSVQESEIEVDVAPVTLSEVTCGGFAVLARVIRNCGVQDPDNRAASTTSAKAMDKKRVRALIVEPPCLRRLGRSPQYDAARFS